MGGFAPESGDARGLFWWQNRHFGWFCSGIFIRPFHPNIGWSCSGACIICNFVNNIKDFDIRHIDEMMTIDDIRALIASDESRTLELKKTTGELKDGMHAVGRNFRLRHFLTTEPATA